MLEAKKIRILSRIFSLVEDEVISKADFEEVKSAIHERIPSELSKTVKWDLKDREKQAKKK